MNHADSLKPDWWRHELPDTFGDKRNYVLTLHELKQYGSVLAQMKEAIDSEESRVRTTVRAIERKLTGGSLLASMYPPRCTTLAHVLQFMVEHAKGKLALMQVLLAASKKRVELGFGTRTKQQGDEHEDADLGERDAGVGDAGVRDGAGGSAETGADPAPGDPRDAG